MEGGSPQARVMTRKVAIARVVKLHSAPVLRSACNSHQARHQQSTCVVFILFILHKLCRSRHPVDRGGCLHYWRLPVEKRNERITEKVIVIMLINEASFRMLCRLILLSVWQKLSSIESNGSFEFPRLLFRSKSTISCELKRGYFDAK